MKKYFAIASCALVLAITLACENASPKAVDPTPAQNSLNSNKSGVSGNESGDMLVYDGNNWIRRARIDGTQFGVSGNTTGDLLSFDGTNWARRARLDGTQFDVSKNATGDLLCFEEGSPKSGDLDVVTRDEAEQDDPSPAVAVVGNSFWMARPRLDGLQTVAGNISEDYLVFDGNNWMRKSEMKANERSQAGVSGNAAGIGNSAPVTHPQPPPRPFIPPAEEFWIVERLPKLPPPRGERYPTQGELHALRDGQAIPLPLKHTEVNAEITAFVASVAVRQEYQNPWEVKIEAEYVFPLPEDSAVTDFVMVIGERRIRGVIREREEARRIYEEARRQGHRAALLTQERPNIFTQKVANIEPGKEIDVEITYFHPLHYSEGEYEFVFPMVVGPRYNPPGDRDGIGATGREGRGASGQKVEVAYMKPDERSGHDIGLSVKLAAGVELEKLYSPTHAVEVRREEDNRATVSLRANDSIPNRDFVLRYRLAGERLRSVLLTNRGDKGNTFALLLHPPATIAQSERMPREMIFVLDCSGSMSGTPIAKAKQAVTRCLKNLDKDDTFQVIRFSEQASEFASAPVAASGENVRRALSYVARLEGEGGTNMIEGIKAALDFPHEEGRLRVVSFLTDGYIGNEDEILAAIHERLGDTRIFSFGVGTAVNRHLIESMASFGRGAVAYVGLEDSTGREVDRFFELMARPCLTDVEVDWGGMQVKDVYPRKIPDLFPGRPVVITGRFDGDGSTALRIHGRAGRDRVSTTLRVNLDDARSRHPALASLWARSRLRDLANEQVYSPSDELRHEMLNTSLDHRVLCRYTAFLAVDSLLTTAGDHGVSVRVPVPVPEGVRYDTTVKE